MYSDVPSTHVLFIVFLNKMWYYIYINNKGTTMTNKLLVALDLGNAQTKIKTQYGLHVYPTSLLPRTAVGGEGMLDYLLPDTDVHVYHLENSDDSYIWGDDLQQFNKNNQLLFSRILDNRYTNPIFKLQLEFALARAIMDFPLAKDYHLNIVTGVPTDEHIAMRDNDFEVLSALLKSGKHVVFVDGQRYEFVVDAFTVMPQPVGSVVNRVVDKTGNINTKKARANWKVGDLGGRTGLIDEVDAMNLNDSESHATALGSAELIKGIRQRVLREQGQRLTDAGITLALRNRSASGETIYHVNDRKEIKITEQVNKEIDHYTQLFLNEFEISSENIDNVSYILITGGGVNLINQKMFAERVPDAIFEENSETANVNGYYKFGLNHFIEE